jgi:hypothetical protein
MVRTRGSAVAIQNLEQLICCLYGINPKHEIARIGVYVKDGDVRLSGPNGSHPVDVSNTRTVDGWKREAALVWNLSDLMDVPHFLLGSGTDKAVQEELKRIAGKRNRRD